MALLADPRPLPPRRDRAGILATRGRLLDVEVRALQRKRTWPPSRVGRASLWTLTAPSERPRCPEISPCATSLVVISLGSNMVHRRAASTDGNISFKTTPAVGSPPTVPFSWGRCAPA